VYGWWFDQIPDLVSATDCNSRGEWTLLYVGISPKQPPSNGKPPSRQALQSRVKYHYRGNAEGSTLRLTLGVLLSDQLGIELRRVGSGKRRTFSTGEQLLSAWMADHARVNFVEYAEPWLLEKNLISTLVLPLNLDQNTHGFRPTLSALRSAAKARAEQMPILLR